MRQIIEARLAGTTNERDRRWLQADLDLLEVASTSTVLQMFRGLRADGEDRAR